MLVWDNTQTLHHSFPYDNDGSAKRELYRTQASRRLTQSLAPQRSPRDNLLNTRTPPDSVKTPILQYRRLPSMMVSPL